MVALALQNANKCNEGQTEILQKKYTYQHKNNQHVKNISYCFRCISHQQKAYKTQCEYHALKMLLNSTSSHFRSQHKWNNHASKNMTSTVTLLQANQ